MRDPASMPEYGIEWRWAFRADNVASWRVNGGLHPDVPLLGKMLKKYNQKLNAREEDGLE